MDREKDFIEDQEQMRRDFIIYITVIAILFMFAAVMGIYYG